MLKQNSPIPHWEYDKSLRDQLPPKAFMPAPKKLWLISAHILIILLSCVVMRFYPFTTNAALQSIIIAHSLTCLAFLAHELSHNAIVRNKFRYPLEILLWGLNGMPATMWQRIHNQTHHVFGNTIHDPDRYYTKAELQEPGSFIRGWDIKLFHPNRAIAHWNPLVWFYFVTYTTRHLLAVCYPGENKPSIVPYKPVYTPGQRIRILIELGCIVLLHCGIYIVSGSQWQTFIWASPIALCFTSAFVMAYVWTNHYLHGLYEVHDPVNSSTSVIVPPLLDLLHSNFSYHTEHHIFPSLNSDYYPLVSELLEKQYPNIYHRIPIRDAWRQLFQNDPYIA